MARSYSESKKRSGPSRSMRDAARKLREGESEALNSEAIRREVAMQLVALLPLRVRLWFLLSRPLWIPAYLLRLRWERREVVESGFGSLARSSSKDPESWYAREPDALVSPSYLLCLKLESKLIDCGREENVAELGNFFLHALGSRIEWREFDSQLVAHMELGDRLCRCLWLAFNSPFELLRYLLRVRSVTKEIPVKDLPESCYLWGVMQPR